MSGKTSRTDYDAIAPNYDRDPWRGKESDAELFSFLAARANRGAISVLDLGCGTGNQLVANLRILPAGSVSVGVDYSREMLRVARGKSGALKLVHATGEALPFGDGAFDFVCHQFVFHHVNDRNGLLREVRRVLTTGGRFVLVNLSPRDMQEAPLYRWFPRTLEMDLEDFSGREWLHDALRNAGFMKVAVDLVRTVETKDLRDHLAVFRHKDSCSELTALSEQEHREGVQRMEREIAGANGAPIPVTAAVAILTARGTAGDD